VCGNTSSRPVIDAPLRLEVKLTDRGNRRGTAVRTVMLRCDLADPEAQELCRCECAPNFVLGRCNTDGGARDL
jgi:hypothetical protein